MMMKLRDPRLWQAVLVAVCGVSAGAVAAFADVSRVPSANPPKLARQLDTNEIQMRAMQTQAMFDQAKPVRVADLFGESDEEKAARMAKEQSQDAAISQLNQKVNDLEDAVRRLTGQNEQLDHRLSDANARMERMQKDFDYKLCTMSAQQLGASANAGEGGLPCGGGSDSSGNQSYNSPPPAAPHLAPPPSVLGTIPSNTPLPLAAPGSPDAGAAAPVPNANRPQFDAAMNLLSKMQYDEARAAFRGYADSNPKDELTPQAVYWVGAISYVQKDYPNAARAFAEEIKKYGSSPRAPDSMLKLGQSLIAMNQKQEGCTTLGALPSKYPQASQGVLTQAKAARKTAGCK